MPDEKTDGSKSTNWYDTSKLAPADAPTRPIELYHVQPWGDGLRLFFREATSRRRTEKGPPEKELTISLNKASVAQIAFEFEKARSHGTELTEDERKLAKDRPIDAIKAVRARTGLGLKEAHEVVQRFRGG